MIGEELGGGVIEGASMRPISREARQQNLTERFERASREAEATGEVPFGYDDLEDWFETQVESFRSAKLPIPERPGFMRTDEWTQDRLLALSDQLGRKLDVPDVTSGLRRYAIEWLRGLPLPIDFEYLRDMRYQIDPKGGKRAMSIGQAKGVLNCAVAAARRAAKPKPAAKGQKADTSERITEDGMYRTADGTIFKVQKAVALGNGSLYAKRLVVLRDAERDENGTIVVPAEVRFEYAKGAVYRLRPEDKMTLDEAKAFGALYGTCCNCGRMLTNEESIAAGIGPICAKGFS